MHANLHIQYTHLDATENGEKKNSICLVFIAQKRPNTNESERVRAIVVAYEMKCMGDAFLMPSERKNK